MNDPGLPVTKYELYIDYPVPLFIPLLVYTPFWILFLGPTQCFSTSWLSRPHSPLTVSSFHSISWSSGLCPWTCTCSHPETVILSPEKAHSMVLFLCRESYWLLFWFIHIRHNVTSPDGYGCLIFAYCIHCIWHSISLKGPKHTLEESNEEDMKDWIWGGCVKYFSLIPKSFCSILTHAHFS